MLLYRGNSLALEICTFLSLTPKWLFRAFVKTKYFFRHFSVFSILPPPPLPLQNVNFGHRLNSLEHLETMYIYFFHSILVGAFVVKTNVGISFSVFCTFWHFWPCHNANLDNGSPTNYFFEYLEQNKVGVFPQLLQFLAPQKYKFWSLAISKWPFVAFGVQTNVWGFLNTFFCSFWQPPNANLVIGDTQMTFQVIWSQKMRDLEQN